MPSSSSPKRVLPVRDVARPGKASAPLNLVAPVRAAAPPPKAEHDRVGALLALDGSGGGRAVLRPLGRMVLARAKRVKVRRPRRPSHRPHASALLLDFSDRLERPQARRMRPAAPFLVALSGTTALTLLVVAGVQLVQIGSAALSEAGLALQASHAGLEALAAETPATASAHFDQARAHLSKTGALLDMVAVDSRLAGLSPAEHGTRVVRAAEQATAAGTQLAGALAALDAGELPEAFGRAEAGLASLEAADASLAGLGPLLSNNLRATVESSGAELRALRARLAPLQSALPTLASAAGADGPRRYMLLFQNTNELRGTGGFMGSFALLDMDDRRVTRFEFRDVYTVDWRQDMAPEPPAGLRRYYQSLRLRDANYSPDFPTAAHWIEWYYERSGGTTLDGVLAVDSELFLDMLEALGPVTLPGTDTELTRENAMDLLTTRIETSKDDPAGPKDVLAELMPVFAERLRDRAHWAALAPVLDRAIAGKHLQAYAKDPALQALIAAHGLDGAFPAPRPGTAELALVSTNVGGNKSDPYAQLSAIHRATVRRDGSVGVALELTKTFQLPEDFDARIAPLLAGQNATTRRYLRHVLGDGTNKDYLRVFLPLGTTIQGVDGLDREDWELHEEVDRTVLGLHLHTQVGETRTLTVRYELPLRLDFVSAATYRFRALKQPGLAEQRLVHELTVEPGLSIVGTPTRTLTTDLSGPGDASAAAVVVVGRSSLVVGEIR